MQAARVRGKVQRDLAGGLVGGSHVPDLLVGVPVHGRLEQESVSFKQVASTTASRADVIKEFALTPNFRIARPVEGQPRSFTPGGSSFCVDAVVDARFLVDEFGRGESINGGSAGVGHGGALVGLIDCGMAAGASLVADITVPLSDCGSRSLI